MDLKEREVVVRSCCRTIETGMYHGIGHRASGNRKHRGSHSSAYIHIWMNRSPPTKRSWLQHSTAQRSIASMSMSDGVCNSHSFSKSKKGTFSDSDCTGSSHTPLTPFVGNVFGYYLLYIQLASQPVNLTARLGASSLRCSR